MGYALGKRLKGGIADENLIVVGQLNKLFEKRLLIFSTFLLAL
jgi:hypothetical protein